MSELKFTKDELPRVCEGIVSVLFVLRNGDMCIGSYAQGLGDWVIESNPERTKISGCDWCDDDGFYKTKKVLYWMRIPKHPTYIECIYK